MTFLTLQWLYSVPPLLTALLLVGLALLTLARASQTKANRLLALLCFLGSLLYIDYMIMFNAPSAPIALKTTRIGHMFHPFLLPLFVHFFHAHLNIIRRKWLIGLVYSWAIFLSASAQSPWLIQGVRHFNFGYFGQGGRLYPLMAVGTVMVTFYNLSILFHTMQAESDSHRKNKLKYVFIGFGVAGLLTSLNILTLFGLPLYPPGCFGFIPLGIFGAGVLVHDLLDMGLLIRKSLIYSLITGLMTGLYALIITGGQSLFKESRWADSILFPLLLFALITVVFGPLKHRVQKILDHIFDKNRYDYQQTIKQVSRTIATILDYETISKLFNETFVNTMGVIKGAFYLLEGRQYRVYAQAGYPNDSQNLPTIKAASTLAVMLTETNHPLQGHQLRSRASSLPAAALHKAFERLDAEVFLPMRFKNRLNGFLVLGQKRSGDLYSKEDLDMLETLCHQSALAIENARAFQALKALNQSLEAKVAERTRDLETALKEKERTQEQLIRSESLAALGQLVAGVAHELNNPLASVTSLLQSVKEDLENEVSETTILIDLIDDLNFADKELARAKTIVASLLGLSRQTQTYAESVNMNFVVRDALQILHNQYKHARVTLNHLLQPDLPALKGNFANLGQVVLNIIQNAFQAVDRDRGRIELTTDFDTRDRRVRFHCCDNGPGIDPAMRKDVFKPFFTTKPVGQGTGLGLYICHEIVTRHGGTISIAPNDNQGTLVTVCLPVDD